MIFGANRGKGWTESGEGVGSVECQEDAGKSLSNLALATPDILSPAFEDGDFILNLVW